MCRRPFATRRTTLPSITWLFVVLVGICWPATLTAQPNPAAGEGWTELLPGLHQLQTPTGEADYRLTGELGQRIVREALEMQIRLLKASREDPVSREKLAVYEAALAALERPRQLVTRDYFPSDRPVWARTCSEKTIPASEIDNSDLGSTSFYSLPGCSGLEYTSDAGTSHDGEGCKDDISDLDDGDCTELTGDVFQSFKIPHSEGLGVCHDCPDDTLNGLAGRLEDECTTGSDAIRIYRDSGSTTEDACCGEGSCGDDPDLKCLYGRCRECLENTDCPTGENCDVATGFCVAPPPTGCWPACGPDEICINGTCFPEPVCDASCSGRVCSGPWDCNNGTCPQGDCFRNECLCVW